MFILGDDNEEIIADYRLLLDKTPDFSHETVMKMRNDPELGDLREVLVEVDRYRAKLLRLALAQVAYALNKERKSGVTYQSPTSVFIEDTKKTCSYIVQVLTEKDILNVEKALPHFVIECRKFVANCIQLHETLDIIADMVDSVIECWFKRLRKCRVVEEQWLGDLTNSWAVLYEFVSGCTIVDYARVRMSEILDFWINEANTKIKTPSFLQDIMINMLREFFALFD
uniref:Exocyst subunit Exo70 family protein n=1 Tax=Steinernema glaseri TaxID=37863 RepID=A0A1I8A9E0_9BILA